MTKSEFKKLSHVIRFNLWYFPIINAARMNNSLILNDLNINRNEFIYFIQYAGIQFINRRNERS